jgi:hypothetical protein
MISEQEIETSERKALQAMASVVYDIAGSAPEGESEEAREERFNAAGRFLYDLILELAQSKAALMLMQSAAEADGASKQ